ncbi:MAG: beta strand repeat-containing protein [Labedaea sp.]
MQTWAKRGLQTALVTGGLLMLGTGIASADEDVNPDKPASAIDGSLTIPVRIDQNAFGTPLGPVEAPAIERTIEISPSDLGNPSAMASGVLGSGASGDTLTGNRVAGDLVVPVNVSGNAIALGGDAVAQGTSDQSAAVSRPQVADGAGGTLAGNVVDLDYALPVQVTGNAISGIGNAYACSTSTQSAAATGDIMTDGRGGTLAGNVVAGQWATPLQATGNAISGLGSAAATSDATTEGTAGGWIWTNGDGSFGSGTVGAIPLAVPLEANGNALGAAAVTGSQTTSDATATVGDKKPGRYYDLDRPNYVLTSGNLATAAGTVVAPAVAGPVSVNCNSGGVLGLSGAGCATVTSADAGGNAQTDGFGSAVGGNMVDPAVALPAEVIGNAAAVGGDAIAVQDNAVSSTAGGGNQTHGTDGAACGNVIAPMASGPVDVMSNAAAAVGSAVTGVSNTADVSSGGFTGTVGTDSLISGNTATTEAVLPAEGFGNGVAALGEASTNTTETKVSSAGGPIVSLDPAGFGAANVLDGALAGPAQVMGNGAGIVGDTSSVINAHNTMQSSGDATTTGNNGSLAGNIGRLAVSAPTQVFGSNATAGGTGVAQGMSDTQSTAGGKNQSNGIGGFGAGNLVDVPAGGAAQAFGESVAALGLSGGTGQSSTASTAGGTDGTAGTAGTVSGNVVTAQAMPIVQSFGAAAAALGGLNGAAGSSATSATSGGAAATNGDFGTISGNLLAVPALAAAQPSGDAVSAIGSTAFATSAAQTNGTAGGATTTSGVAGLLSGMDGTVPLGADAPVYDVPVALLANALTSSSNSSNFTVGETKPTLELAYLSNSLKGLSVTQAPRMPELNRSSRDMGPVPGLEMLSGLLNGLPLVGGLPVGNVAGGLPTGNLAGGLPTGNLAGGLPTGNLAGGLPTGNLAGGLPVKNLTGGLPTGGLPGLPGLPAIPAMPGLPAGLPVHLNAPQVGAPALPALGQTGGLPVRVPALPGLDTPAAQPAAGTDSPTLADTRSKLAALFSDQHIS